MNIKQNKCICKNCGWCGEWKETKDIVVEKEALIACPKCGDTDLDYAEKKLNR